MAMTTGDNNTAAAGRLLESLLGECVRQDASDLHLVPDLPPYLRVEGLLRAAGRSPGAVGRRHGSHRHAVVGRSEPPAAGGAAARWTAR